MRSRTILAASLAAAALGPASSAAAAGPERVPLEAQTFEFGAGEACAFPVTFETVVQRETLKVFDDRLIVTGANKVVVTNQANGKSIFLNASGPGFLSDAGEFGAGRGVLVVGTGEFMGPGVYLLRGRTELLRDEDGRIVGVRANAAIGPDLCDQLA